LGTIDIRLPKMMDQ